MTLRGTVRAPAPFLKVDYFVDQPRGEKTIMRLPPGSTEDVRLGLRAVQETTSPMCLAAVFTHIVDGSTGEQQHCFATQPRPCEGDCASADASGSRAWMTVLLVLVAFAHRRRRQMSR